MDGMPNLNSRPLMERVHLKYEVRDDHWLWTGSVDNRGKPCYGKKQMDARALLWEEVCGPLPPHTTVRPTCREKLCVNPIHQKQHDFQVDEHRRNYTPRGTPLIERILQNVCIVGDCWICKFPYVRDGQHTYTARSRTFAHYHHEPELGVICYTGNRLCVHPDHLSEAKGSDPRWLKTRVDDAPSTQLVCDKGHLMVGDEGFNTRDRHGRKVRRCVECQREQDQIFLDMQVIRSKREILREQFLLRKDELMAARRGEQSHP